MALLWEPKWALVMLICLLVTLKTLSFNNIPVLNLSFLAAILTTVLVLPLVSDILTVYSLPFVSDIFTVLVLLLASS